MKILSYISLTPTMVSKNGSIIENNSSNESFDNFIRKIYKKLGITYPKFFKMDELSKLAFIAGEVLLGDFDKNNFVAEKTGIIIGNKSSSLTTDIRHYNSIKSKNEYFPSPSVFVYTLPNIMIGELCIRHNIQGENSCFIFDKIDSDFFFNYTRNLFENDEHNHCITGWVDYTSEEFEAHLFLISNSEISDGITFGKNYYKLIHKH